MLSLGGHEYGGPGAIQTDPEVTEFPGPETDVTACCYGTSRPIVIEDGACRSDCGRAACNRILAGLRAAADPMNPDPSEGACDPLIADVAIQDCRNNIRTSIESWISQIEGGYDQCVTAAVNNRDPSLLYTDPAEPFGEPKKLPLADWGCSTDDWGCLHDAELRPYCEIDGYTDAGSCEMAGNPADPNGGEGLDETGPDEDDDDDGDDDGGIAPFGDIGQLVSCVGTTCTVAKELLDAVQTDFEVFYEEDVELVMTATGLRIAGLDDGEHSKALLGAFDVREGDVITTVNASALSSWASVAEVISEIEDTSVFTITVDRPVGSSWVMLEYVITMEGVAGVQAAGVEPDPEPAGSSCACRASSREADPLGVWLVVLGLVVGRRCRRARDSRARDSRARYSRARKSVPYPRACPKSSAKRAGS